MVLFLSESQLAEPSRDVQEARDQKPNNKRDQHRQEEMIPAHPVVYFGHDFHAGAPFPVFA